MSSWIPRVKVDVDYERQAIVSLVPIPLSSQVSFSVITIIVLKK